MNAGPVVVTGAGGFVGRALCAHFARLDRDYRAVMRDMTAQDARHPPLLAVGDFATASDERLAAIVGGARAVVHLAGRAHVMREKKREAPALYAASNTIATQRVAAAAARAGVARFVLASTVKVHGEATRPGHPLRASDPLAPEDAYARSKADAEQALALACAGTAMAPIVLRLPLVYGPGVKGNFLALVDAVARRAWLPLGALDNRRDLLYAGNLVHAIAALVDSPQPLAGAWLIADGEALATPDLIRRLAAALGVEPRLASLPEPLVTLAARLAGRGKLLRRLAGSLEADSAPLRARIGAAPFTVDQGLAETARWWRAQHSI